MFFTVFPVLIDVLRMGSIDGILKWDKVRVVDLSRTQVTGELRRSWRGRCKHLQVLKLSDSRARFVPRGDDLIELMDLKQMNDRLFNGNGGANALLPALTSLEVSGCQLNAPVQNLILPLAACEHLGTIKAANCGLQDGLPSLDPMPPTTVDREVRLGERSYLASSLETLDLSGNNLSYIAAIPPACQHLKLKGNQQPLLLAEGELSKAVQFNVLIDLRSTLLQTDTTNEAKELRGSFEQRQPGVELSRVYGSEVLTKREELLAKKILQNTSERVYFPPGQGYSCYDLNDDANLLITPSLFLPEEWCACMPGWSGNGPNCTECEENTFSVGHNAPHCTPCPESATSAKGSKSLRAHDGTCKTCPQDSTAPRGSTSPNACTCPSGQELFHSSNGHLLDKIEDFRLVAEDGRDRDRDTSEERPDYGGPEEPVAPGDIVGAEEPSGPTEPVGEEAARKAAEEEAAKKAAEEAADKAAEEEAARKAAEEEAVGETAESVERTEGSAEAAEVVREELRIEPRGPPYPKATDSSGREFSYQVVERKNQPHWSTLSDIPEPDPAVGDQRKVATGRLQEPEKEREEGPELAGEPIRLRSRSRVRRRNITVHPRVTDLARSRADRLGPGGDPERVLGSNYRRRRAAAAEAAGQSRARGTVRESIIQGVYKLDDQTQACSSCDERQEKAKKAVREYASRVVERSRTKPGDKKPVFVTETAPQLTRPKKRPAASKETQAEAKRKATEERRRRRRQSEDVPVIREGEQRGLSLEREIRRQRAAREELRRAEAAREVLPEERREKKEEKKEELKEEKAEVQMDPQQVQEMANALQQLQTRVNQLATENEALRNQHLGMQAMAESIGELAKNLGKKDDKKDRRLLVDTKGLGKPEMFNNDELGFRRWSRTICNLTVGVFGKEFQDVLEFCLDRDDPVDMTELVTKFGIDPEIDPEAGIPGLEDKCDQLYRVLSSLTSGESEDLVVGCANLDASGYEAWRRLNRRWDPVTAGRKRNILRAILNPERTKSWEGVRPAIEQLDDLIRRYEARKNESGAREVLSDDIKCTAIELLVPQDLEKHLILNKSRLTNYSLIKQEIEVLMETTLGSKSKIHRPGSAAASSHQGPAPMEVDAITQWLGSLVKGKGKGKGSGKGNKGDKGGGKKGNPSKDIECYNCGKKGHKASDCWAKKSDKPGKGNSKGKKGKGKGSGKKGSKGTGKKGAAAFEEAEEYDGAEEEPAPEEEEMGLFEVNGTEVKETQANGLEWMKFNFDTGAAQTAIPEKWNAIKVKPGSTVTFKTASGELVPGQGTGVYEGSDENGGRCRISGPVTNVHKPLVSAYRCMSKGRLLVLDENGGHIVPLNTPVAYDIQKALKKASWKQKQRWIPVYQENGIYNFYLKGKSPEAENPGEPEGRPEGEPGEEYEVEEIERPVQVRSPSDPTTAEVEEHEATGHVQYRTWCKHCVAGRGIGQQHRTREEELRAQDGLPVIASDYTFMSQSGAEDGRAKPILVVKDSRTSSVAATFVDAKGPTPYAVKYFTNFLKSLGYKRVVMQSDGEPSIVALKTAAADAAGVECVPRESAVGEHQANGLVENACKEIKRQVRVARSALEEKVGRPLSDSDPVLAWLPMHVGDLMNRYKKGTDGKTPESRRTGKQWRKPAISYGERLYYRMVGENVRGLKVGRYIGHHGRTGSLLVITADGVQRGTGIRRLGPAERRTAKSKAQQSGERKRPGQMTMARGPPLAKPKPSPAQGEKRAAETPAEELRDEVTPAEPGAGTSPPSEMQVERPQPGDVSTLTKAKRQLKALIKRKILDTYEVRSVDITEEDAEAIALMSCEMAAVDVMEIYSPKRFTEAAAQFKLRPGFAVDLCEEKPEGGYWDLRKESDVQEVREWIDKDEPALLTGSPPCHMFSLLQNISWYKLSPEVRERRMKEALNHLHVSCEMYRKQYDAGRWFLHEAPWSATSWTYPEKESEWYVDQCVGLARQAAIYPPKLVKAVLRCLKTQLEGKGEISSAEFNSSGPIPEEKHLEEAAEMFWDDVNGGWLPPAEVRKARDLELDYLRRQAVYEKRPISECYEVTGKKPIGTRWLDTDKGDPRKPNFRSRLVVREIKAAKAPEDQLPQSLLFSSTPPLEAMRLLCSLWSSQQVSRNGQRLKLGLWDISRAHFYGTPKRTIYIELPDEDKTPGKEECGLLTKSMYGTQDAPAIWQAHYTGILESAGFKRGRSNASVFYREADGVRVVVHGDDFLALGDRTGLDELDALLRRSYELKRLGTLGDEEGDDKEVHFLNRLIRVGTHHNQPAVFLEPDRRHVDLLIRNLGLEQAKGVDTPDVKKSVDQQMLESRSPILGKELSVKYRSSVMRAAYLSQDRPDI
eukprot:symbB.v1.2.038276.t1/scaffold5896.1/size48089/1